MDQFSQSIRRSLKLPVLITLFILALSSAAPVFAQSDIVLYAAEAPVRAGNWRVEADSTAAGGTRMRIPDAGLPRLDPALANPANYFEISFNAEKGIPYRLWLRGKADGNSTNNDSAWVQFSGSVDQFGSPIFRTSTTSAAMFNVEDCTGCGLSGWGWNDDGYGGMGPLVYFANTGVQTVRVQLREDGLSLDQIVLSPVKYLNLSPGFSKNDSIILSRNSGAVITAAAPDVVLWTSDVPNTQIHGSWMQVADSAAAGQIALQYPDFGGPKLTTALASPLHYFEIVFNAQAGVPYRLWMRAKAIGNSTNNDSVWVQFSSSLNSSGGADYRIGTTSAIMYNMEECTGCGLSNWGWNDSGINGLGPVVSFSATGQQVIRVQMREDGINLDQIVLSPQTYLSNSPGAFKNDTVILPRAGGVTTVAAAPPPPNQAPQVSISAGPSAGIAPLSVGFNSSAFDPDGSIVSYNWNFGDGQTSTAVTPSHLYQTTGTFSARLTVTDNAGAATSAAINISVSSAPTSTTRLKVLQWNTAYGRGTDNIIDLNRQATWLANMQPDLISLNEVPPENVSQYVSLLQQKTGITWFSYWVAITPGNSVGQEILSRYPLQNTSVLYMSNGRSVAHATVSVGGKLVNFFSTHLSYESSAWRMQQINELNSWTANFAEPRIVAGDFNLWDGLAEYTNMTTYYYDSWKQAKNAGTAISYPDNPDGKTRGGRIDYVLYSKSANVALIECRMPDQRDLNNKNVAVTVGNSNDWGVRPSDHNFIMTTFDVR